jgi:hypothetical protein
MCIDYLLVTRKTIPECDHTAIDPDINILGWHHKKITLELKLNAHQRRHNHMKRVDPEAMIMDKSELSEHQIKKFNENFKNTEIKEAHHETPEEELEHMQDRLNKSIKAAATGTLPIRKRFTTTLEKTIKRRNKRNMSDKRQTVVNLRRGAELGQLLDHDITELAKMESKFWKDEQEEINGEDITTRTQKLISAIAKRRRKNEIEQIKKQMERREKEFLNEQSRLISNVFQDKITWMG